MGSSPPPALRPTPLPPLGAGMGGARPNLYVYPGHLPPLDRDSFDRERLAVNAILQDTYEQEIHRKKKEVRAFRKREERERKCKKNIRQMEADARRAEDAYIQQMDWLREQADPEARAMQAVLQHSVADY